MNILVKLTSMFSWIYQYSGTFNQNFLSVLYQLENFSVWMFSIKIWTKFMGISPLRLPSCCKQKVLLFLREPDTSSAFLVLCQDALLLLHKKCGAQLAKSTQSTQVLNIILLLTHYCPSFVFRRFLRYNLR